MNSINDGVLVSSKVTQKVFKGLHRGQIGTINAIIVHQTDADTAQQTFNKYSVGRPTGAHFLIDKQGVIFQTALLTQKCVHVGKIKSRCYEEKSCTKKEYDIAHTIYHKKDMKFSVRVKMLHMHEIKKEYPDRYPTNQDSIGIEIVGAAKKDPSSTKEVYEPVNAIQSQSLKWLLSELYTQLHLEDDDVYRHPQVSRKNLTEASSVSW